MGPRESKRDLYHVSHRLPCERLSFQRASRPKTWNSETLRMWPADTQIDT